MVAPASPAFWGVLIVLVIASATQDIAIDALAIRITPHELLGVVNSARVAAYRGAMLAAPNARRIARPAFLGWRGAFLTAAVVPLIVLVVDRAHRTAERGTGEQRENPLRSLLTWLRRPAR